MLPIPQRKNSERIKDAIGSIFAFNNGITNESLQKVADYFKRSFSKYRPENIFSPEELDKPHKANEGLRNYSRVTLAQQNASPKRITPSKVPDFTLNGFVLAPGTGTVIDPTETPIHNHAVDCFSYVWKGDVVEVGFNTVDKTSEEGKKAAYGTTTPKEYKIRHAGDANFRVPSEDGHDTHAIMNFSTEPAYLIHIYAHGKKLSHANKEFPQLSSEWKNTYSFLLNREKPSTNTGHAGLLEEAYKVWKFANKNWEKKILAERMNNERTSVTLAV